MVLVMKTMINSMFIKFHIQRTLSSKKTDLAESIRYPCVDREYNVSIDAEYITDPHYPDKAKLGSDIQMNKLNGNDLEFAKENNICYNLVSTKSICVKGGYQPPSVPMYTTTKEECAIKCRNYRYFIYGKNDTQCKCAKTRKEDCKWKIKKGGEDIGRKDYEGYDLYEIRTEKRKENYEACNNNKDCISGLCYNTQCIKKNIPKLGDCKYDKECFINGETKFKCHRGKCYFSYRLKNESCTEDHECASGLCRNNKWESEKCFDNANNTVSAENEDDCLKNNNKCLRVKQNTGLPCDENIECKSDFCYEDPIWNSKYCIVPYGHKCKNHGDCQTGLQCKSIDNNSPKKCIRWNLEYPSTCNFDSECKFYSCINNKCLRNKRVRNGEFCYEDIECQSENCLDNKCLNKKTDFGECSSDEECNENSKCENEYCRKKLGAECKYDYHCLSHLSCKIVDDNQIVKKQNVFQIKHW